MSTHWTGIQRQQGLPHRSTNENLSNFKQNFLLLLLIGSILIASKPSASSLLENFNAKANTLPANSYSSINNWISRVTNDLKWKSCLQILLKFLPVANVSSLAGMLKFQDFVFFRIAVSLPLPSLLNLHTQSVSYFIGILGTWLHFKVSLPVNGVDDVYFGSGKGVQYSGAFFESDERWSNWGNNFRSSIERNQFGVVFQNGLCSFDSGDCVCLPSWQLPDCTESIPGFVSFPSRISSIFNFLIRFTRFFKISEFVTEKFYFPLIRYVNVLKAVTLDVFHPVIVPISFVMDDLLFFLRGVSESLEIFGDIDILLLTILLITLRLPFSGITFPRAPGHVLGGEQQQQNQRPEFINSSKFEKLKSIVMRSRAIFLSNFQCTSAFELIYALLVVSYFAPQVCSILSQKSSSILAFVIIVQLRTNFQESTNDWQISTAPLMIAFRMVVFMNESKEYTA
ncbi:hypothetical protein HK096_002880, partial [Nowakowskiella sp. JEL0078]